jgi:Protein ChrB, N-terminal
MSHKYQWLLFFYTIPAKPGNLRMKVWRRLLKMGAISLKGSVYILPSSDDHLEALHWLTAEVAGLGGEAAFVKVERIETLSNDDILTIFNNQRDNDYEPINSTLEVLEVQLSAQEQQQDSKGLARIKDTLRKVRKDYRAIQALDFFHSPEGSVLRERLALFEERLQKLSPLPPIARPKSSGPKRKEDYQAKIWVTRFGLTHPQFH